MRRSLIFSGVISKYVFISNIDGCPINVCPSAVILDTVFNSSAVAVTKTLPSFKPLVVPSWFDIVTSPDTSRSVNFPVLGVVAPIGVSSIEPPLSVTVDSTNEYAPGANVPSLIFSADMDPSGTTTVPPVVTTRSVNFPVLGVVAPISVPSIEPP